MDWEACARDRSRGSRRTRWLTATWSTTRSRERVHYLNHTAVMVLELCTGQTKAADMPGLLQVAYELPEAPMAEVRDCLEKLFEEGLVH